MHDPQPAPAASLSCLSEVHVHWHMPRCLCLFEHAPLNLRHACTPQGKECVFSSNVDTLSTTIDNKPALLCFLEHTVWLIYSPQGQSFTFCKPCRVAKCSSDRLFEHDMQGKGHVFISNVDNLGALAQTCTCCIARAYTSHVS